MSCSPLVRDIGCSDKISHLHGGGQSYPVCGTKGGYSLVGDPELSVDIGGVREYALPER